MQRPALPGLALQRTAAVSNPDRNAGNLQATEEGLRTFLKNGMSGLQAGGENSYDEERAARPGSRFQEKPDARQKGAK